MSSGTGTGDGVATRLRGRRELLIVAVAAASVAAVLALVVPRAVMSGDDTSVRLVAAFGGRVFDQPVDLVAYPGERVLLADKSGLVVLLHLDGTGERAVVDLRGRVAQAHEEQGLLSIAIDPAFDANRQLWAYYIAADPDRSVVARFTLRPDDTADPASELVVLEVTQPFGNHNGGALRFGPDGMLYLGLGDGGDAGDPLGSGQDLGTLHSTIIRIDVGDASPGEPYAVPPDNPFVGTPSARPEIWAYGLRNPWRMSFDPATGQLWTGDVGQDHVEEVNLVVPGGNYGWSALEGDACFRPGCDRAAADAAVAPLATYSHDDGCAITGGVVYRGSAVPTLDGRYVFGDLCTGAILALEAGGGIETLAVADGPVVSFGVDERGEVYVLQFGGPVLQLAAPERLRRD